MCMQKNIFIKDSPVVGSEDCLYMNIYLDSHAFNSDPGPVLVFMHGGLFATGGASSLVYNPDYIYRDTALNLHNFVLVVVQYRLSALGFLSTGDEVALGNFGLKDQQAALRWIQKNIAYFHGDPSRVTLMGEASPVYHMLAVGAIKGNLFSRAISFSGSALSPVYVDNGNPLELARRHAAALNIPNANKLTSTDLINEMRKVSGEDIIRTVDKLRNVLDPPNVYRPVIEKRAKGSFLIANPRKSITVGNYLRVPLLLGETEGDLSYKGVLLQHSQRFRDLANANNDSLAILMELEVKGEKQKKFLSNLGITHWVKTHYNVSELVNHLLLGYFYYQFCFFRYLLNDSSLIRL